MATADEYAQWIVDNQAKNGTPEFDIVARAYQDARGQKEKPAVVSAGETLRQIPRQIGLTARHAIEGAGEVVNIGSEPIRAVVNPLLRAAGLEGGASASELAKRGADAIGLPKPEGATERVVGDASRMVAGSMTLGGAAKTVAGKVVTPVVKEVAGNLAANQGTQAISAAGAGGAGGAVREAGGGPVEQFVGALVGGLSTAGATALVKKAYDGISGAIGTLLTTKQSMQQVNVTLNQILGESGINISQVPSAVRGELAHEVKKALDTGRPLNPDVVRRIADYGVVGATPTRGAVSLDPVQITQERNLAKLGANSSDPKLQQLARVQNENNAKFIENLNTLGGNTANADARVAGEKAIGAVAARDAAAKGKESGLYGQARDSSGRQVTLDREGFVFDAYNRLGESNKSAFLPEGIKTVLEQIRTGKSKLVDGTERELPFNVDVIDQLKTMLATASRSSQDGNVRAAIKNVRDALENVQPQAGGAAEASLGAFDKARQFARARRTWQESAPGIGAALDDANPDRFVKDYILTGGNKGATADVERLMFTIRRDPQAAQAVKENVVGYLKSKALGGAADEVGNFSQSGFNNALKEIGDAKLRLFFKPEELAQLKTLGRVASYEMVQPKGSAVNNSNTAGTFATILDRIASSPLLGKIPLADSAVRVPARNWSVQIGTDRALDAGGAVGAANAPSREMMRLEQLLGPGLLLAAPRADGRDDEKRR